MQQADNYISLFFKRRYRYKSYRNIIYRINTQLVLMNQFYTILFILLPFVSLFAQPSNDGCLNSIPLINTTNWCSNVGEFSNIGATESDFNYPPGTCMTNANNDVWFSFLATAPDVTITIIGYASISPGGNLIQPEAALYTNGCGGAISQLECATDNANNGIIELYEGGLTVGQIYLIRVDGRFSSIGTFQICINNYYPAVEPGSDCISRAFLCEKESFTIPTITGAGLDSDELANSCLGGLGGSSESNSTWFSWTCSESGTLTFTLTPTNPSDDLDFVVYELPNGLDDCTVKIEQRCMAAGDFDFPSPCMGPTGLNLTSTDVSEPPGCGGGNDNWVKALDMVAGTSYALAINNFTSTGNGFSIDWGGTGEFEGSVTNIILNSNNDTICMGNTLTVDEITTTNFGSIIGRSWNFGVDATPATATGPGPHSVTYSSVGVKSITFTAENSLGCLETEIFNIVVDPCCETVNTMDISATVNELECFDDPVGEINVSVNSPFPITSYEWDTGDMTEDINGLTGGDYTVTVTNEFCEEEATFTVPSPPPFEFDTVMTLATCGGGQDGSLTLNVSGATPPFLFDWNDGNGFTQNNQLTNIPIGFYDVTVRDDNNCEKMLTLEVKELELMLDPTVEAVTPPTCFGFDDGSIQLVIANGQPPFLFDWNDGNGFVSQNTMEGIVNATFFVDVMDANGCFGAGQFELVVEPPPPLEIDLDSVDVSCFGESDGSIIPHVVGGVGGYQYQWSAGGQTDSIATGLPAGMYFVTVWDANDCVIEDSIEVVQPIELGISHIDVTDVLCFGDATGEFAVTAFGGNPPYSYSVDGIDFQTDSVLIDIPAGTYDVTVMDTMGCMVSQSATIREPLELIALPGEDLTVNLGYSIQIPAEHYPPNKPVTVEWSPTDSLSCTDCFMPYANPAVTTTYTMTITDWNGCVDSALITVFVDPKRPIYIPNAFSPNNDGVNDVFTAYSGPAARRIQRMQVFNRWGDRVFDGANIPMGELSNAGWNGRFKGEDLNPGVYVYVIDVEFVDSVVESYRGDIALLR